MKINKFLNVSLLTAVLWTLPAESRAAHTGISTSGSPAENPVAVQNSPIKATEPFSFDFKSFDFGNVTEDANPVVHEFKVTNTSEAPILIRSAVASCGCTRPTFTTKPILPGETGEVKVTFMPRGQKGYISKDIKVTILHNGGKKKRVTLKITGTVTPE